jgi:hypothetical protein
VSNRCYFNYDDGALNRNIAVNRSQATLIALSPQFRWRVRPFRHDRHFSDASGRRMASSEIGKFIWPNRPTSVSQVTGVFLPPLQTAGLRRAQAMTQLSAKILARRMMIVCLTILMPCNRHRDRSRTTGETHQRQRSSLW